MANNNSESTGGSTSIPAAISPSAGSPARRKRLSKFFRRPLDKVLRNRNAPVRDSFTLLRSEHNELVRIKRELADQDLDVKKSDLVRAALSLLFKYDAEGVKRLLEALPQRR